LRRLEAIYREILLASMRGAPLIQQTAIAEATGVSLGLTNKVVRKLEQASTVEAGPRGLRILSPGRILNLWATERHFRSELWRSFRVDDLDGFERDLPVDVILTAFPAWVRLAGKRPAEYSSIHFYITDRARFASWMKLREQRTRKTNPNVFALLVDDHHLLATSSRGLACVPQVYVDIYATDGPAAPPFLQDITASFPSLGLW
jgi:hypothetical protein